MSALKFGVMGGGWSPTIWVGRLSKRGDVFLEKEDATDMVLAAVGEYVRAHFDGGLVATFPGMGFDLEVKVTERPSEATA